MLCVFMFVGYPLQDSINHIGWLDMNIHFIGTHIRQEGSSISIPISILGWLAAELSPLAGWLAHSKGWKRIDDCGTNKSQRPCFKRLEISRTHHHHHNLILPTCLHSPQTQFDSPSFTSAAFEWKVLMLVVVQPQIDRHPNKCRFITPIVSSGKNHHLPYK